MKHFRLIFAVLLLISLFAFQGCGGKAAAEDIAELLENEGYTRNENEKGPSLMVALVEEKFQRINLGGTVIPQETMDQTFETLDDSFLECYVFEKDGEQKIAYVALDDSGMEELYQLYFHTKPDDIDEAKEELAKLGVAYENCWLMMGADIVLELLGK